MEQIFSHSRFYGIKEKNAKSVNIQSLVMTIAIIHVITFMLLRRMKSSRHV
jgi:hypothetical protein